MTIFLFSISQILISLSSAPVAKNFPSGEKHTERMYKSDDGVDEVFKFSTSLANSAAVVIAVVVIVVVVVVVIVLLSVEVVVLFSVTEFRWLLAAESSDKRATKDPSETRYTCVVLLQPVAKYSPSLLNFTQQTTEV